MEAEDLPDPDLEPEPAEDILGVPGVPPELLDECPDPRTDQARPEAAPEALLDPEAEAVESLVNPISWRW